MGGKGPGLGLQRRQSSGKTRQVQQVKSSASMGRKKMTTLGLEPRIS